MKKTLIALAALAATGAFAQTTTGVPGFQIVGNLNAGFVANSYWGKSVSGFDQNMMGTSQIGFRGKEDLGGGLSAHFVHTTDFKFMNQLGDSGVMYASATPNNGAAGTFGNDQKFVGIAGPFGTVNFGAINNASLYSGVVLLNPTLGTSYSGGYGATMIADPVGGQGLAVVRFDNTMEYKSPVIGGFSATVQYAAKQDQAINANYSPNLGSINEPSMIEIGVKYADGPLTLAAVHLETDASGVANVYVGQSYTVASTSLKKTLDTITGAYDLGNGLRLAGSYQHVLNDNATVAAKSERDTFQGSALYRMGANEFVFNYGQSAEKNDARTTYGGQTSKLVSVAYKYYLSKMTTLEAKYENLDDQAGIVAATAQLGAKLDNTRTRSGLGIMVQF